MLEFISVLPGLLRLYFNFRRYLPVARGLVPRSFPRKCNGNLLDCIFPGCAQVTNLRYRRSGVPNTIRTFFCGCNA